MEVKPVSGDLLVKLALVAVGVGVVWYAASKAKDAFTGLSSGLTDVLFQTADYVGNAWNSGAINPASTENVIYSGINSTLFPAGNNNLGGWIYDLFHEDPMNPAPVPPKATFVQPGYTPPKTGSSLGDYLSYDPTPGIY